jgi:hypothetical protein
MKFAIKSRKFGEVEFSRPGNYYVYVDLNGKPGTLGNQICDGGGCTGDTIGYRGNSDDVFEKICRKWWRAYLRDRRDI